MGIVSECLRVDYELVKSRMITWIGDITISTIVLGIGIELEYSKEYYH